MTIIIIIIITIIVIKISKSYIVPADDGRGEREKAGWMDGYE
jgi:hypothetical protein